MLLSPDGISQEIWKVRQKGPNIRLVEICTSQNGLIPNCTPSKIWIGPSCTSEGQSCSKYDHWWQEHKRTKNLHCTYACLKACYLAQSKCCYRDVSDVLIGWLGKLKKCFLFIDPTYCVLNKIKLTLNHSNFLWQKYIYIYINQDNTRTCYGQDMAYLLFKIAA